MPEMIYTENIPASLDGMNADDADISLVFDADAGVACIDTVYDDAAEPVRVLKVGDAYQSATYLGKRWSEPVFEYYRAFDALFDACDAGFDIRRVLMLGGGGCSYPKHLLTSHEAVSIDVVEADAQVAHLAKRLFFVDRLEGYLAERGEQRRFSLHVADAREYVEAGMRSYDAIINDVFAGAHPADNLIDDEGLTLVHRRLVDGGMYLVNVVCDESAQSYGALHELLCRMKAHFAYSCAIPATDEEFGGAENYIAIATDGAYRFKGAIPE